MRKIPALFLVFYLFIILTTPVFARHEKLVLGTSTESSAPAAIAPTSEGPGFIQPDSPLFFLDRIKQSVRLLLAFTPEQKAVVHSKIAGERLAELRFMLAKNNTKGIKIALEGVSTELQLAADQVAKAQYAGRNVQTLSERINNQIKDKKNVLATLETETSGELKQRVILANEGLTAAKVKVEDTLPEDKLKQAIKDDLEYELVRKVSDSSSAAALIDIQLDELRKQTEEASREGLLKREEALKKAIEDKNKEKINEEEYNIQVEKTRQARIKLILQESSNDAKKAIKEAREASIKFQKAKAAVAELNRQSSIIKSEETKSLPSPTEGNNKPAKASESDSSSDSKSDKSKSDSR